ncbi:MAG: MoaD/ThiS family protein [bacterium]
MIEINVRIYGALKCHLGSDFKLTLNERITIENLLESELKYKAGDLRYLVFVIDSKIVNGKYLLGDKDKLEILLPVAGG